MLSNFYNFECKEYDSLFLFMCALALAAEVAECH